MSDPNALITAFVAEFDAAKPDVDKIMTYFADDAVYHNIPVDPVRGKDAIAKTLGGLTQMESGGWEVRHQVASGEIVMNERVDRFKVGDKAVAIPVMGVFRVVDGKILEWRDYFDMGQWQKQMA